MSAIGCTTDAAANPLAAGLWPQPMATLSAEDQHTGHQTQPASGQQHVPPEYTVGPDVAVNGHHGRSGPSSDGGAHPHDPQDLEDNDRLSEDARREVTSNPQADPCMLPEPMRSAIPAEQARRVGDSIDDLEGPSRPSFPATPSPGAACISDVIQRADPGAGARLASGSSVASTIGSARRGRQMREEPPHPEGSRRHDFPSVWASLLPLSRARKRRGRARARGEPGTPLDGPPTRTDNPDVCPDREA